jgi:hypothetical protein
MLYGWIISNSNQARAPQPITWTIWGFHIAAKPPTVDNGIPHYKATSSVAQHDYQVLRKFLHLFSDKYANRRNMTFIPSLSTLARLLSSPLFLSFVPAMPPTTRSKKGLGPTSQPSLPSKTPVAAKCAASTKKANLKGTSSPTVHTTKFFIRCCKLMPVNTEHRDNANCTSAQ